MPLLLPIALAALPLLQPQGAPTDGPGSRPIRSLVDTADADDDPLSLGGLPGHAGLGFTATVVSPVSLGWTLGGRPNTLDVVLTGVGTAWQEHFLLQVPLKTSSEPQPLLMVFHKYGSKANDPYLNTTFPLECAKRGWFMLTALGATKKSFGSIPSQINRDAAIDWMLQGLGANIDMQRIYGVGFSMGAGSVASWAARHQDPAGPRMAAMVAHTGGFALEDTWLNDPPVRTFLEFWHGGPPSAFPFEYQRSSVVSFDPFTKQVDHKASMGTNLAYMPMYVIHATGDPLGYLVNQTQVFRDFMVSIGGLIAFNSIPYFGHDWDALDEKDACGFLSVSSLKLPMSGQTLADDDGTWFWFDIEQDYQGAFTPFSWELDEAANRFELLGTSNLAKISFDVVDAGLDPSKVLEVCLAADDFFADTVELRGYTAAPSAVLRDGLATSGWSWHAATEVLTILEQDTQKHSWEIQP